jgi:16S rRNA processing protein RimM
MPAKSKDLVEIGEVGKPHGIAGEVRVRSFSEDPELFSRLPAVYLAAGRAAPRKHQILSARGHKGFALLALEGVPDRNAAEALKGAAVLAREEDLPGIAEDEIYLHELLGARVVLENGEALGTIRDFILSGEQEVWAIEASDGREVLLPVNEETVLDADPESGQVKVSPPPGLLEIYLGE